MADGTQNGYVTRVEICNITDPEDMDLNGRRGVLCRPFRSFYSVMDAAAGVRLDPRAGESGGNEQSIAVRHGEWRIIEAGNR